MIFTIQIIARRSFGEENHETFCLFLFVINNFPLIFYNLKHYLNIVFYIIDFLFPIFPKEKKESSETFNRKIPLSQFRSLKRATFSITEWLPIIRLLALLCISSQSRISSSSFSRKSWVKPIATWFSHGCVLQINVG